MSGFYSSSPWSGAGDASSQIGASLQKLTATMAQRQMLQRFQQQQMALKQQQLNMQRQVDQSLIGQHNAQAGFDTARTQHQGLVDQSAKDYQGAVVHRAYPNPMANGPTIDDSNQRDLAMEMGMRALVRGLGGNVDNPPTATINPGQMRINTLSGQDMGYLPPNPTFHSVPAGGTPFVLNSDGQAQQAGNQTGFAPRQMQRPAVPTFHPATGNSLPAIWDPSSMTYTPINTDSNWVSSLGTPLHITNMLSKAFDSSPQSQQQGQRVRVQGPNGETGTVDATEQLPAGWKPIQ